MLTKPREQPDVSPCIYMSTPLNDANMLFQGTRPDGRHELVVLRDSVALLRSGILGRRLHQIGEVNSDRS